MSRSAFGITTFAVVIMFGIAGSATAADTTEWLKPTALKPGDTIALVAPASAGDITAVKVYAEQLVQAGYKVRMAPDIDRRWHYLAGDDEVRAAELNAAFRDPVVRAVIAIRGGYGLSRILDRLDYDALRRDPKIVAGYSDLTALHMAISRKAKVVTFHSPMPIGGLAKSDPDYAYAIQSFRQMLFADQLPAGDGWTIALPTDRPKPTPLVRGTARGRIQGGNLSLVTALSGTPYALQPEGAILLLEDVNEEPYRVDRMLSTLRLAGVLDRVAGVILGDFHSKPDESAELDRVLRDYFGRLKVPVVTGFPAGHVARNATLPHGAEVELNADQGTVRLLYSPVHRVGR
jgi:muramoyltetrapeptide carboxypeptidase